MIKIVHGVPIDAIKHKMICDNLDPNILDSNSNSNSNNTILNKSNMDHLHHHHHYQN